MMKPKRDLCVRCKRPLKVCFCREISSIENYWPIYIFQHYRENRHPLGTATIAQLCLINCQILITNKDDFEKRQDSLLKQQPLLVYPGEESTPIENLNIENPIPLIFLDGTWRKTKRFLYETPALSKVKKLSIDPKTQSNYRIRKTPNPQALSTLEAIVYVLSFLEKSQTKYEPLINTMNIMINKQIEMMGENTFRRNYGKQAQDGTKC